MTNWTLMLCLNCLASALLIIALMRRRWLLIKPSVIFVSYYQLSVMWPGLFWYEHIDELVPVITEYVWALHGTGLAVTIVALLSWRRSALRLARRIEQKVPSREIAYRNISLLVLGGFILLVTIWYIAALGWRNMGLTAILSGVEDSGQMREEAMKLLGNRLLQYVWALMAYAAAYLVAYWLAFSVIDSARTKRLLKSLFYLSVFLALLVAVALPGARSPVAMVVLATLVALYIRSGFRIGLVRIVVMIAAALILPAILTLLRNNEPLNFATLATYYLDILDRVAGRSVLDNIWMVSYAQKEGLFGTAGVSIFARLIGSDPIDVFNVVGLYFKPDGIQSISANSSMIAVNYASFGLVLSGALSLAVTLGMDGILLFQSRLPNALLAPCTGICAVISMNFAMTAFSTVFITHGLLPTIAMSYIVHFIVDRSRVLSAAKPPGSVRKTLHEAHPSSSAVFPSSPPV